MLDATEYLHLAMHASQEDNHHAALGYLKEALQLEPDNARALYFLGAEHAQLGLFERALGEMLQAVQRDPNLDIAWFQAGLLGLQLQRPDQARAAFAELCRRGTDRGVRCFAQGYLDLLNEQPATAAENFEQGLQSCHNAALAADMRRVLDSLVNPGSGDNPPSAEGQVYLGAYRNALESS